jgi:hypothetical protein
VPFAILASGDCWVVKMPFQPLCFADAVIAQHVPANFRVYISCGSHCASWTSGAVVGSIVSCAASGKVRSPRRRRKVEQRADHRHAAIRAFFF